MTLSSSLFPDALKVVLDRWYLNNETLRALSLVSREAHHISTKHLWTNIRLQDSASSTPLANLVMLIQSMQKGAISITTQQLIHTIDLSQVQETLYLELPPSWLLTLLSHAPQLQSLNLANCTFLQPKVIKALSASKLVHSNLLFLNLSNCQDLREEGLKQLAFVFPSIQHVILDSVQGLSDMSLALLVDHCNRLEVINLAKTPKLTDLGLVSIAKFCRKNLKSLDLTGNRKITNSSVLAVAKHCPKIETLILAECTGLTDFAIEWIARSSTNRTLRILDLHGCDKISVGLPLLQLLSNLCTELRTLSLSYHQLSAQRDDLKLVLEAFRDFSQLRTLEVYNVPEHSPAQFFWDLAFQASFGYLEKIWLYRGSFETDYILGNYTVAAEYAQNIGPASVAKFNEARSGLDKAKVYLVAMDNY